jgi:hypothetical protein
MADFNCTIKMDRFSTNVSVGSTIKLVAEIVETNKPVRSVIFCVDKFNMRNALRRENETKFKLDFPIPPGTSGGNYSVSIWAVSEDGERSTPLKYEVLLK